MKALLTGLSPPNSFPSSLKYNHPMVNSPGEYFNEQEYHIVNIKVILLLCIAVCIIRPRETAHRVFVFVYFTIIRETALRPGPIHQIMDTVFFTRI